LSFFLSFLYSWNVWLVVMAGLKWFHLTGELFGPFLRGCGCYLVAFILHGSRQPALKL
jgi:hypothetical protein